MALVKDVLDRKGHRVVAVSPEDTVLQAAKLMNEERIGAVVVFEPSLGVVGIFTERDVLRRVVAECRPPEAIPVGEVMSHPVTCCRSNTPLLECQGIMTAKRLRHLPVVENDELIGLVSIGDITAYEVQQQQTTIEYLSEYIYGRT
jgi:CBS domain-containing protein